MKNIIARIGVLMMASMYAFAGVGIYEVIVF